MNSSNLEVPTTLLPYDSRVFELEHIVVPCVAAMR